MRIGRYKHTKTGKLYRVLSIAKHSETLEEMVVYECLYANATSRIWVRPKTMFEENVQINGALVPRFQFLGE